MNLISWFNHFFLCVLGFSPCFSFFWLSISYSNSSAYIESSMYFVLPGQGLNDFEPRLPAILNPVMVGS